MPSFPTPRRSFRVSITAACSFIPTCPRSRTKSLRAYHAEYHGVADSYYGDGDYVTGNATAARDLKDSFSTDNILVSVLSAVFVVLVIMFVFRSAGLSVLLIAGHSGQLSGSTSRYRISRRTPSFLSDI